MRTTFAFSAYSPGSSSGFGFSSPALSDVSSSSTPRLDSRGGDRQARGYGSSILGGEVYCPHVVKERRYEPPGTPVDFDFHHRQLSSYPSGGSPASPRSEPDLCDHCESIAKLEVERFFSTLAAINSSALPRRIQKIDPTRRMSQQDPPPCNTHYLRGKCATGSRCRYGHDYELNGAQIEEIRRGAKWHPCSAVQHGLECPDGDSCIYGHSCPKGLNCRKPDCAFGADINAEIIDLHGYSPVALRELVWQNSIPEYYPVYPRVTAVPATSPYYEIVYQV
ncbi:hypothetical protein JCM11491_004541 [Sporobolomyces phaffii]